MKRVSLILGDILVLYASLLLMLLIRYGQGFEFQRNLIIHIWPFSIIFFIWVTVFYMANLYDISFTKNNLRLFTSFFYAIVANSLIAIALFYLLPVFKITPKTNFFIFLALYAIIATPWRYYFNKIIARQALRSKTLILGLSDQSQELYNFLLANPQIGYETEGIVDVEHNQAPETIENLVKQKKIQTLVLGPAAYKIPRIVSTLYRFVRHEISFHNLSDFFEKATGKVPLSAIDQVWFLENLSGVSKRGFELMKRVIDVTLAVILGIPHLILLPFIALAIKLDSAGPIFYRQLRTGKGGKVFELVKFRNMIKNAESKTGPVWASEDDSRVTQVGKFLRRSRIDELPQIWNVLKGEMSFIGPRPERPEFHEKLKKEIPFYEERYLVKPGLTGWAQTKFKLDFRGGMTTKDIYEKLQYDLFYIKNRSILLDAAIVLKTVRIVLKKLFS